MTGLELERMARQVVPPVGATAVRMTTVATPGDRLANGSPSGLGGSVRFGPVWLIDGGRRESRPIELFDRQVDALRFYHLIAGTEPAPRAALATPTAPMTATGEPGPGRTEASAPRVDASQGSAGSCAGCGGPLPPGRHGQRRLTCSTACRQRVRYLRAAEATTGDADSGSPNLTPSRPSEAVGTDHGLNPGQPAAHPEEGGAPDEQLAIFAGS